MSSLVNVDVEDDDKKVGHVINANNAAVKIMNRQELAKYEIRKYLLVVQYNCENWVIEYSLVKRLFKTFKHNGTLNVHLN